MKKLFTTIMLFAIAVASAQEYGQTLTVGLWDNVTAPHSNGITLPEAEVAPNRPANVTEAVLYIFGTDRSIATGQAVVICPGGGYRRLAMDHEGYELARWFAAHGISAAVLKYRMPNGRPEVPLEDAEQALRIMRGEVEGAGVYACHTVGIVGSSAGGHLAATVSTMGAVRPDFSVLFYPVITSETGVCHEGSFDELLGEGRSRRLTARYSLERAVDQHTPPAFLMHSDDDRSVPSVSSTRYYEALKSFGTEASLHIYPSGGHGWGMRDSFPYKSQWQEALLDWLAKLE